MDHEASRSTETENSEERVIRVTGSKVAIVPVENADMIGSLYIHEMAKDRLNQGFVKYKGPNVIDLTIGAYVSFSAYSGTLAYFEGEGKLLIMPEEFVVCELMEPKNLIVPGLFFRSHDGYFIANYELAMEYIARAFSEDKEWRDSVKVVNKNLDVKEYDKLKAGAGE